MARGAVTKIEGFREARETLQTLTTTVQRNVGKRALKPAAEVIAGAMQAAAPVSTDPYNKTPGSLKAAPQAVTAKAEKGQPRAAVIVEDPAAVPIEYGTVKMAAKPFARRAADNARGRAAAAFAPALKAEVEAAARRAAKRAGAA